MAVSDTKSGCLRLRRTDSVPADATAKHVDQLEEHTYDRIACAARDGVLDLDPSTTDLAAGDVVVFTHYLRVERA